MPLPPRWRWKLDRWRENAAQIFLPAKKETRPRLCPSCGRLAGATATRCPQCGASLTFSLAAASRSLSNLMPATSPATYFLLALNILLFALSLLATMRSGGRLNLLGAISPQVLNRLGASLPLGYDLQQPWRFVLACFLHGGLIHIGFNMLVLMDLGPFVEELYGSARYLFLYLATGVAAYLLSATLGHFSVGASGALMGLVGLMLAVTTRRGGAYMQMLRGQLLRWLLYIFVLGILMPGIDNAAHLGGLVSGFLLGHIVADRQPDSPAERTRAYALGWIAGLAIVASLAAMLAQYFATRGIG